MHIATAGDNRIWTYNLGKRELRLLAGSGALGVSDGSGNRASFAQPVGLATVQQVLYACDAAGSAIRSEIGRAHVCTPVTNAHPVCRLLLETKTSTQLSNAIHNLSTIPKT